MTIIHKTSYPHTLEQCPAPRNWMGDGWAEVPEDFSATAWACLGYCDITLGDLTIDGEDGPIVIPNGVVTAITPHEVPPPPEPEPQPDYAEITKEVKALQDEFTDMDAALQAILEVYDAE